jgi:hypothetical protein
VKQYHVYADPQGQYEAVKQGWSWPGFFFNMIWALVKKMWLLGAVPLAFFFTVGLIEGASGNPNPGFELLINALSTGLSLVYGYMGNEWREKNLRARGFEFAKAVSAETPEGAIADYLKNRDPD